MGPRRKSLEERFWPKVNKIDGCWLWTKGTSSGYGIISNRPGPPVRAHVVGFFLREGRWPEPGMSVLHTCHNPLCVRHTYEGTQAQNSRDMVLAGRENPWQRREENYQCGHPKSSGNDFWKSNRKGRYRTCLKCVRSKARKASFEKRRRMGIEPNVENCPGCFYSTARCDCIQP